MNHFRPGLPVAMLVFSRIPIALLRAGFPLGRSTYLTPLDDEPERCAPSRL